MKGCIHVIWWISGDSGNYSKAPLLWIQARHVPSGTVIHRRMEKLLRGVKQMCETPILWLTTAKCSKSYQMYDVKRLVFFSWPETRGTLVVQWQMVGIKKNHLWVGKLEAYINQQVSLIGLLRVRVCCPSHTGAIFRWSLSTVFPLHNNEHPCFCWLCQQCTVIEINVSIIL